MNYVKNLVKILLLVQCLLLILFGCSKIVVNKTVVADLEMYSEPPFKGEQIGTIPFKEKVEIIENKIVNGYIKVKYKETIGYILSQYLSDRDDVPFVDDIKLNHTLNEFEYDRDVVVKAAINAIYNDKFFKDEIQNYYTENPQIFAVYGKDCDDLEVKKVAVSMVSKLHPNFNQVICFRLKGNKLGSAFGGNFSTEEELIEFLRDPGECE